MFIRIAGLSAGFSSAAKRKYRAREKPPPAVEKGVEVVQETK
jgi:hypothetical protein